MPLDTTNRLILDVEKIHLNMYIFFVINSFLESAYLLSNVGVSKQAPQQALVSA